MKTCWNCGAKNFDINRKCEKCKKPLLSKLEILQAKRVVVVNQPREKATAAKILLLIDMILWILLFSLTFILWSVTLFFDSSDFKILTIELFLCMIIFMIPMIVAIIIFKVYSDKLNGNESISTSFKVGVLLFVNLIAGILMLCDGGNQPEVTVIQPEPQQNTSVAKMKEYKELLDSGIITQEEFDEKKKQLLEL